jgi:hypothetical protein
LSTGADFALDAKEIALRQGSEAYSVLVDGVRVALTWAATIGGGGGSGNVPPSISSPTRTPWVPAAQADADLQVHVTDDHTVTAVKAIYTAGATTDSVTLDPVGGDDYQGVIPGTLYPTDGTPVSYYFKALDDSGAVTITGNYNFLAGTTPVSTLRNNDGNGVSIYHNWPVRVRGIVTAGDSVFSGTNTDIFVQDATGGVNIFKSGATAWYPEGDELSIEGTVTHFNGKLEVSTPNFSIQTISTGNPLPDPVIITPAQLPAETYEGMYVIVTGVDFDSSGTFNISGSGVNYTFNGDTNLVVRIDIDTDDINGTLIPSGAVNVRGVVAQFDNSSPYASGYQLQPRRRADIDVFIDDVKENGGTPRKFALGQNFPNPFNPSTVIGYQLSVNTHAALIVYNLLGQEVRTLVREYKEAGSYRVTWDGKDNAGRVMPTGVYFYRLSAGNFVQTRKMVLMK